MRGGKSLLVLLVIALGLGSYAYLVESKRDLSDTGGPKPTKVMPIDAGKVEEVEVKAASGEVTTLKKNGSTWQIVGPEPMDADQDAVSTIVSSLSSLETTRTVDENPTDVKPFDLDPPRATVGIRLSGETAMRRLDLGTKTPTGADLYARVEGQPKVFLIGASADDQLDRTTFDLRDKSLLKFDREKADSLTLAPAGTPAMSFVKKGHRRLADGVARRREGRLQRGRRPGRPALPGEDEVVCRRRRRRRREEREDVRPRQAPGRRDGRRRDRRGRRWSSAPRPRTAPCTRATCPGR